MLQAGKALIVAARHPAREPRSSVLRFYAYVYSLVGLKISIGALLFM